jgi:peptide/nickel transport system ATP-binding protein
MTGAIVEIRDFSVTYAGGKTGVPAVRDVNLRVEHGQIVGLVGESGSGKSSLVSAMLALLPKSAKVGGDILIDGKSLYRMDEHERRTLRGRVVATVSQDPFTALNPVIPVGTQLVEFQHRLGDLSRAQKKERALAMLTKVGLSDPEARMRQYPHQLSGGIRQRVAIAAALLVGPKLLIADEPTTALDATTEAQIIDLIREMRGIVEGSIVFVTHDMGVVGELCDQVAVMYAGELVETGPVSQVFAKPKHPYTRALLRCDPARIDTPTRHLPTIAGAVPSPTALPPGCIFSTRCESAFDRCRQEKPRLGPVISSGAACHLVVYP